VCRPENRVDRPGRRFFPVFDRFWRVDTGFLAERFCTLTGPDSGPVPGPTGRSGPVLTTLVRRIVYVRDSSLFGTF
jgi:hypothetical protein